MDSIYYSAIQILYFINRMVKMDSVNGEPLLSIKDQKTRKWWLFWMIQLPAFFGVFLVIGANAMLYMSIFSDNSSPDYPLVTFILYIGTIFYCVGLYISYYCVYMKYGTALLAWGLFFASLTSLSSIYKEIARGGLNEEVILTMFFYLIINAPFFWLNYKVRKINQKAQQKMWESREDYSQALQVFQLTHTLEALEESFKQLVYAEENRVSRDYITKAYRVRRNALKAA